MDTENDTMMGDALDMISDDREAARKRMEFEASMVGEEAESTESTEAAEEEEGPEAYRGLLEFDAAELVKARAPAAPPPLPDALRGEIKGLSPSKRRAVLSRALTAAARAGDLALVDTIDAHLGLIDSRADRRASRDKALRSLEPKGAARSKEHAYDPRLPAMQELYAHKTDPMMVSMDGGKLIRADGGEYGMTGGKLRAVLAFEQETGTQLTEDQRRALVKHVCWDDVERIHGIGTGYTRDACWTAWLWCQQRGEQLDLARLPRRQPLPDHKDWVGHFEDDYVKQSAKVHGASSDEEAE